MIPADHPHIQPPKTGILIANLGTPDGYDYWSMRRYLNEFLSDRRVIDYPAWKWQPILQAMVLSFEDVYILVGVLFLLSLPLVFFLGSGRHAAAPPVTAE